MDPTVLNAFAIGNICGMVIVLYIVFVLNRRRPGPPSLGTREDVFGRVYLVQDRNSYYDCY